MKRIFAAGLLGSLVCVACGGDAGETDDSTTASSTASASSSSSGSGGSGGGATGSTSSGPLDPTGTGGIDACTSEPAAATLAKVPVDVIVIVDNSSSMVEEIDAIEANIAANFAAIVDAAKIDYRVILISRFGDETDICIEAPLSTLPDGTCDGAALPAKPADGPRFFHYDQAISSNETWCEVFNTFARPDETGAFAKGWSERLRPEAFKAFVSFTDDYSSCAFKDYPGLTPPPGVTGFKDVGGTPPGMPYAVAFDKALLALSPEQFGTEAARNYRWHGVTGLAENATPNAPYAPSDPLVEQKCASAFHVSPAYQQLSIMTGGLRYPICNTSSYDAVFKAIADDVIKTTPLACEFVVPKSPTGETLDLAQVAVEYTPSSGDAQKFSRVAGEEACGSGQGFYLSTDAKSIELCPATCADVKKDPGAKIDVLYGCLVTPT